ncbi:MAG: YihY family inner membrane protein [Bacteriovoracaceae bacterium]|nr:YihY family inner membrane protein [Bacteriovoracaceae bacterium]
MLDVLKKIYLLFFEIYKVMKECQVVMLASSLSYMTSLALLPLAAFCFYIYKAFGGVNDILLEIRPLIFQYFAPSIGEQVYAYISNSLVKINFEAIGATGLIVFLVTSIHLLNSVESVINKIWKVHKKRHFLRRWARYFSILIIAPFLVAILFSTATISGYIPLFRSVYIVALILIIILGVIYKSLPNCHVRGRASFFAAIVSSMFLLLVKHGYALYLQKALAFNTLYGSLAVLPIMQLWIYIIWLIILFGVILSEVINRYLNKTESWHKL